MMYDSDERYEILDLENAGEKKARRNKQHLQRKAKYKKIEDHGICEGFEGPCLETREVSWIGPSTSYPWDKDKDPLNDPNRRLFMCEQCAAGYYDHWKEMWTDYYNGRL